MHAWLLALLMVFGSWRVAYVTLEDRGTSSEVRAMDGGIIPPR